MTIELPTKRAKPDEMDPEDRLFTHKNRPAWGVGVWMREERTRRRLRFEDGQMRAFKKGYYDMLVPVDSEATDVDEVFERVVGEHAEAVTLGASGNPPVMSFATQIDVFLAQFPDGFRGETYQAAWGEDAKGKHNLPDAVLRAKALKDVTDPEQAGALATELIASTSLVARRRHQSLTELNEAKRIEFGQAVIDLLHGDARFGKRFAAWLVALDGLGVDMSWRLSTALLGLYSAQKHPVVRRRVFQLQARSTSPCKLPATPSLAGYRRARRVARVTRDKLVAAGLEPRSMLDVHAFIWETLRPKGQDIAKELGGKRGS